jgi:phosphatidylglycerol lysyltransferase
MATRLLPRGRTSREILLAIPRRIPFTLVTVAIILIVSAVTGTMARPADPGTLAHWGFGWQDLQQGRLGPLLLAPFQVLRPYMVVSIITSLLLFLGACEYLLGTARAAVSFWVGHLIGFLGGLLLLWGLRQAGLPLAAALMAHRDLGASNGAFGALGAAAAYLPGRLRRTVILLSGVYLGLALLLDQKIWDFLHPVAFLAGYGLGGVFLLRRGRAWPALLSRSSPERRQRPLFLAWTVGTLGFIDVLGGFLLGRHPAIARLESMLPFGATYASHHLLLVLGCTLMLLAPALSRGRRLAWWGTIVALLGSFGLHLLFGVTRLETALSIALLVILLAGQGQFVAPTHPVTLLRGRRVLLALLVLLPLYSGLGFFVLRAELSGPISLETALREIGARLLFANTGQFIPSSHAAALLLASIPMIGWGGIITGLFFLLRGVTGPATTPAEYRFARHALASYGRSGTSYMTLWRGNSLFFNPQNDCYIAYRVCADVAVALGDPVGPPQRFDEIITAFADHAEKQGWDHVFYSATPSALANYRAAGYEALQIGEEAVIPLADLQYKGKEWQHVRSAINRAQREQISFRMYEGGTIPAAIREQLFAISAAWESLHKLPPMEFTLGDTRDVDDPNVNVAVATDSSDRVHAFVDWLPVYERQGWVIDLMRRRTDCMSGVMDFLIGMSLLAFKERGYVQASLAAAPLADLDREENASFLQQILGQVFERFNTFYSFQSLFQFKEKYQPRWESVYLVHRGISSLPRVTRALILAYLPGLDAVKVAQLLGSAVAERVFPPRPAQPDAASSAQGEPAS